MLLVSLTLALAGPSDADQDIRNAPRTDHRPLMGDETKPELRFEGLKYIESSELENETSPSPAYPSIATTLRLGEHECRVAVAIGPDGVPTDARVDSCPKAFHPTAVEAALQWRWKREKGATPIQTTVRMAFKPT